VLPTPCYVFGDAHLGVASPEAERDLLRFLRALPGRARSLVIMGDLFDFWFAWRHVMPRTGFRALAALADLGDAGIEMLWLGGNHDCWGGDALMEATGATYTLAPWTGRIGAWHVHLAHGDGLREKEDAPYRRLRTVLRHPLSIRAFRLLHPDFASRLAMTSSDTSRHRHAGDEGRALYEVAARDLARRDGPELVVHGHSHVPQLARAGRGWYANAGAWYADRQYLVIDGDRIERRRWTGSAEGDVLDVGNRLAEEATRER
jgi:UDP-2,3-diacylglucosamine hydrolase